MFLFPDTCTHIHSTCPSPPRYARGDAADQCVAYSTDKDINGVEIGAQAESYWLRVVPWGFYKLLKYVDERYHPQHIVITENGVSVPKEQTMRVGDATRDAFRVDYYRCV